MKELTFQEFNKYIKENNLTWKQGTWFHSSDYTDNQGVIKAHEISSSWGAGEQYFIDEPIDENQETLDFVGKLIKLKQK